MAFDAHKNFAYSTIAVAPVPASSGTAITVGSGDGTKFPAASFNATIWPANAQPTTANAEIVRVTVIATDVFTITRAQESSSARTVVTGDQIAATITVKNLTDVEGKFPVVAADIGANAATLAKLDASNATANKVLMSGASASPTWSTPTFPNASATSRKKIVSDGTNWVASTETWAVPGTSGNVLTSDGTNWTSAAASGGAVVLSGSNDTEATTTSTSSVDLSIVSSISIATTKWIYFQSNIRKSAGAASAVKFSCKLNSTQIVPAANGGMTSNNHADTSIFQAWIGPQTTNYNGVVSRFGSDQSGTEVYRTSEGGVVPGATITSVTITGYAISSSNTVASNNLYVYAM